MWKYLFIILIISGLKGHAQFGAQQIISNEADGTQMVFVADIDGDGNLDALSANKFGSSLTWYKNLDGTGIFGPQPILS